MPCPRALSSPPTRSRRWERKRFDSWAGAGDGAGPIAGDMRLGHRPVVRVGVEVTGADRRRVHWRPESPEVHAGHEGDADAWRKPPRTPRARHRCVIPRQR